MVKVNEFTCENCGGTFPYAWSDSDAMEEAKENFGDVPKDELSIVCDDCYKEIMAWSETEEGKAAE